MTSFINEYRGSYGVEPICAMLPTVPSTYYEQKAREADPLRLPKRAQRDAVLCEQIDRVWQENREVYGARKVWKQLRREEIPVARCTVERLMRTLGFQGVVSGPNQRRPSLAMLRCNQRIWCNVTSTPLDRTSCGAPI